MHENGEKSLHYLGKCSTWINPTTNRVGQIHLDAVVERLQEKNCGDLYSVLNKCVYTLTLSREQLEAINAKVTAADVEQGKSACEDVRRLEKELEALLEKLAELQNRERNQ